MPEGKIEVGLVAKADASANQKAGQQMGRQVAEGAQQGLTSLSSEEMARRIGRSVATAAKWAKIEAEKAARVSAGDRIKPAIGLGPMIEQRHGMGVQRSDREGYEQWWASKIPPVIGQQAGATAGGIGGVLARLTDTKNGPLSSPLAIAAQMGAALAGLRVAVGYVRFAFNALLVPLRAFYNLLKQTAEQARQNYAKALTSGGLPLEFTTRRNMLADAIGVGEQEVWQYANAVLYLNARIADATHSIAQSTPALAEFSYSSKALKYSTQAIRMSVTSEFAPAMRSVVDVIRETVDRLRPAAQGFAVYWKGTLAGILAAQGNMSLAAMLARSKEGELGNPEAFSRRLPVSSWERMGLVVGMGGNNPAAETARNTKTMVQLMQGWNRAGNAGNPINAMFGPYHMP